MRPVKLDLAEFSLTDAGTELTAESPLASVPLYRILDSAPCAVKVRVRIQNLAHIQSRCIFNLRVPTQCDLRPLDAPSIGHYLTSSQTTRYFMPGVSPRWRSSAAEVVLPPRASRTYTAEIVLPETTSQWAAGWPMQIIMKGINEKDPAINIRWWVQCGLQ